MSYTVMENVINSIYFRSASKKVGDDFLIPFKT